VTVVKHSRRIRMGGRAREGEGRAATGKQAIGSVALTTKILNIDESNALPEKFCRLALRF